jgi:hypothetical protein
VRALTAGRGAERKPPCLPSVVPLGLRLPPRLNPLPDPLTSPCPPPQELRSIISDCWAADPEARPSFEEVVARLERLLKTLPKHVPYSRADERCCSVQ